MWLKFLYEKYKMATDIIEEADRLWRKKLHKSLQQAIKDLLSEQEKEVNPFHCFLRVLKTQKP